jgi:hypothetical protein
MTLEAVFQDLVVHCRTIYDALLGLRLTVVEDKPLAGDVVLVDAFGDAADELLGCLEEALTAATEGQQAVAYPAEVDRARRALTRCQECFNRLRRRFASDLMSYERIAELMSLGQERQGEWLAWAYSVKEALEQCQQLLNDIDHALFMCWQEIAERVGMASIAAQIHSRATTRGDMDPQAESERQQAREECSSN